MTRPVPHPAPRHLATALLLSAAAAIALTPAPPARAQAPVQVAQDLGTIVDRVLTEYERAVIREYLRQRGYWDDRRYDDGYDDRGRGRGNGRGRNGLPPGLQRQVDEGRGLPPGLARQLQQGRGLPPGLQTRPLPNDLLRQLPRREGTRRVIVDRNIVLIDTATNVILDILYGP